jgi:hypothetical protein|tara:strand:- start:155 stop:391 length:237 start_codon:yes stop_codon:yes gene_type:complete
MRLFSDMRVALKEFINEWKRVFQLADNSFNKTLNDSSKSPLTKTLLLSSWYALKSTLFIFKWSPAILGIYVLLYFYSN